MTNPVDRLIAHRHGPFVVALAVAAIAAWLTVAQARSFMIELPSLAFYCTYLGLMAWRFPGLTSDYLRNNAEEADEPATLIIVVTLFAVVISIASLFLAVNSGDRGLPRLATPFLAVIAGWATIHTMAAIHYAHLFWRPETTENGSDNRGGLSFPETANPCGWDFLYFSFVVGMTAQTSDTAITTTRMRRITLLHAVVSYLFNTVLIAAALNSAVSLAS